ncbi:hypothetical protein L6452_12226 [Arctium lappa]|uniref:Uncharacterized protein n=3 Tax=Arctium lappa TaxID=4217 RepID=A0ACB9DQ63_ARCLA|nr:hypothetical protein L6452_12222 [Arctium lappa]KAI3748840.1 hypothetical protein L6452_12224 [Arctium lappa]KAI3748842.1 hypothetical protein L6452_12226 [Arctium lappa]
MCSSFFPKAVVLIILALIIQMNGVVSFNVETDGLTLLAIRSKITVDPQDIDFGKLRYLRWLSIGDLFGFETGRLGGMKYFDSLSNCRIMPVKLLPPRKSPVRLIKLPMDEGRLPEIVDPMLLRDDVKERCLISLVEIGVKCSSESPQDRMDIGAVIHELLSNLHP